TIFGQLVSGQQAVTDLGNVAVTTNSSGEDSQPVNQVTINSATITTQNPNGVLHINAASAKPGETATITVTATDPKGNTAKQTFTVTVSGNTEAVRLIDGVLVVDPQPRTDHGTNVINVTEQTISGTPQLLVTVNGILDSNQPAVSSVNRLVVFGSKASDQITVDPSVTVPATLDGGHGGKNVVKAGSGPTLEHGWFGHTTLVGGTGTNQLIGRKGFVRFQPSSTTNWIFAGVIRPRSTRGHTEPPKGTFYRFVNGRLVPVASLP
ncbi:MAG TPA: hypothetical protein VJY33_03030, partial [Isosphaeraceae bacterium]|nr:hypothetical protein [Isosphaeraceae bacterium]